MNLLVKSRFAAARSILSLMLLLPVLWSGGCGGDSFGPNLQPVLSGADPDSGTVGTQVAITGVNFAPGLSVVFGGIPATNLVVESPGTVLVHAPDGLVAGEAYDIRVTNLGGKSDALSQAFRAVAPELLVVNGVTKPSGTQGSTIIFEGKAFGDRADRGSVWFTDDGGSPVEASIENEESWTNEFVVTTVPNSAGTGPIWIETTTGVSDSIQFKVASGATFSPSLIHWTPTTPLPEASQGHAAVFLSGEDAGMDNVLIVSGGADGSGSSRSSVFRATSDPSGSIGPWSSENSLLEPRSFHGMLLATPFNALIDTTNAGYVYVVGGIDASGAPRPTVYRAPIAPDRSLGTWTTETALPVAVHSMGVVVFRSWVFVLGGATSGNAPVASVFRAPIGKDGRLGFWEAQTSLPSPRAYAVAVQFAGSLYLVGGDAGTAAPGSATVSPSQSENIYSHAVNLRTRALDSSWVPNPSKLIKAAAKHTAVVAGGTLLVSGGIYNGDGNSATEHQYASFGSDGTIASFAGATGSQTIGGSSGAGGSPFFNHAAIVYVDGSDAAHVIILGGNDVNDPSVPLSQNFFY